MKDRISLGWLAATVFVAGTGSLFAPAARGQAPLVCDEYAGDPAFGTPEWTERDADNVACSYQRQVDAQDSPAFLAKHQEQVAIEVAEFPSTLAEWAAEPTRLHVNCCTSPPAKVGDPFRSPEEWAAAGRGRHLKFSLINRDGAKLRARLYASLDTTRTHPAVTFTPGLQSYNEVNSWFAQGMAEAGYVVLIIDPQGQGDSENCGHAPDGAITGCPTTNQPNDTRSAIDFVLSTPSSPYPWALGPNAAGTPTFNPYWESVDATHVGIAGHSLGAIAVTPIGQEDDRVDAVISYDNLDQTLDAMLPRRTPSLYFYTDYAFPATGAPKTSPPDPTQHFGAFDQLEAANVDAMSITTRASDHYEFGYQPYPANLPSSRYGERVAFHYSLAWFDRYLKGDAGATQRLVSHYFDDSSDRHSIGAGTYDAEQAASDPTNPFAGNVPYAIDGKCVANLLSFYFDSAYRLEGGALRSGSMRARVCPVRGTLRLKRARARRQSGPGAQNGSLRVAGELATPPQWGFSPFVSLRIQDGGAVDRTHTFTSCAGGARVRCSETTPEGRFKVVFKLSRTAPSTVRFQVGYLRQAVDGPFAPPVKMTLVHDGGAEWAGEIASCRQSSTGLGCRQR